MLFDATAAGRTARVEVREAKGRYSVTVDDKVVELDLVRVGKADLSVLIIDTGVSHDLGLEKTTEGFAIMVRGDRLDVTLKDAVKGAVLSRAGSAGPLKLTAPMPGKIVKVLVEKGDSVEAGRDLLVMEAMKMENDLKAARAGTVQEVRVREGQAVEMGALLLIID